MHGEGVAGSIVGVGALFKVLPYPHKHRRLSRAPSVTVRRRHSQEVALSMRQMCTSRTNPQCARGTTPSTARTEQGAWKA
jgi:hypothetical protein